ncbi:MAG TPA: tetratricopeptide repeat protein [Opitutaceae bacterium]|jgi:predicted ATPase/class 3 adenylate cyclase
MSETTTIERLRAYLPPDRAAAILGGAPLSENASGSVLFSDISGFTPLTEAVVALFGPRRGGEQFTDHLNAVYDALIAVVMRFGGSIVGFAGDAMVVWFAGDDGLVALSAGVQMQKAMEQFAKVALPEGNTVSLGMKVAIACGPVRRFAVGDHRIQLLDVIAGDVMERVFACESVALRGEIILDGAIARKLGIKVVVNEWRPLSPVEGDGAVVSALVGEAPAGVPPASPEPPDAAERLRPWLLPEVGRRITSGQDVFLTELRPASALFARFTGIDFERDPGAPAKLDLYVRWLQGIVSRLEGVLIQLSIGEKGSYFYAAWGAPIAHEDDPSRACAAALEIIRPPPTITAFLKSTQIGITSGTMRTGAYGGHARRTYGVLGDDTNLAARLMMKAVSEEIVVSARTAQRAREDFELQPLPNVKVKGKKDPIPIFRLVGRRKEVHPDWTSATAMIGRTRERADAVDRLRRTANGRGQVIAIEAEAGMGKTRLLRDVALQAQVFGFAKLAGACLALAGEISYAAWIPIWRSFFEMPPEADGAAALAIVERTLQAFDPALVGRAPLLGPVLDVELKQNELTRSLDPKVRRSSLEGLLIECLRHRSHLGPMLLVLEDCQWIDEASRNLLAAVTQAVARMPCALIVTHRPVKPGEVFSVDEAHLDHWVGIKLTDLPPDDARRLVNARLQEALGAGAVPEWLADLITARAGGNPFFIEEVASLLKSSGGKLSDPDAMATLELPESLHSLALSRIDQLTQDAQTTLKVGSVIGRTFRTGMLFGVHPLETVRAGIPGQLMEMRQRDLVTAEQQEGEEAHAFRHAVLHEVAYESLPFGFRAKIHESIGTFIERIAGEHDRPSLELLAFHFGKTERDDKRRRYLVAAGNVARQTYSLQSAIGYFERALPLLAGAERVEVQGALGEVLELAGRWNDANRRYHEARAFAHAEGLAAPSAAMAGSIGDLHRKRGEFADAEIWIGRARLENEMLGNRAGVGTMLHLEGTLWAQQGEFARATELYRRALSIREELGDEAGRAKTLNNLGIVARSQGNVDTALAYYEQSLAIRRRVNDRREIANSLNNLGFTYRIRKQYGHAQELLEESLSLNRAVGDRWSTANSLTSLAELALDCGDERRAQKCLKESISINRELGDMRALAFLLEACGRLGRLQGEPANALIYLTAARRLRADVKAPLEPADAASLASVLEQIRGQLPAEIRDQIETEGQSLRLAEVLDRAVA